MKIIKEAFDKRDIPTLPQEIFPGRIIVVQTHSEAEKAIDYLMKSGKILGLDTETRPSFKKGIQHQVALLQVATTDTCFLFRLNMIGITSDIKQLLEDTKIVKVGLSLKDDLHHLQQRENFNPGVFVELQNEVRSIGVADMSLQKIYANLFGKRISKGQQLTNWQADTLTLAQKKYAATDAWACIKIYEELQQLKARKNYRIINNTTQQ